MAELMQATEPFFDASGATEIFVAAGEVHDADDAIVKAHPTLFHRVVAAAPVPAAPKPTVKRAATK